MSILLTDAYKLDHRRQFPKGTTRVYSNFTARGSRVPGVNEVVFFGLQYFIKKYLQDEFSQKFFRQNKHNAVDDYKQFVDSYLGPNSVGTEHIAALHDLGYLPLEIRALPEGTKVPIRVPMLTVENTHDDFFWLTNYIETMLSASLWLPTTSATTAYQYRKALSAGCEATGGDIDFIPWQGHDFSFRGMGGIEAAELSGMGHLTSFTGTDTIPAVLAAKKYYNASGLVGGSVPATEHAVMCAHGKEGELNTLRQLLQLYPTGIVSVVSDTWDLWKLLTEYLPALKSEIMARNGKLVIRPDSGIPEDILCGDSTAPEGTPQHKGVIQLLWEVFGGTVNTRGFRVLDSHVGAIYGDAITITTAEKIMNRLKAKGFATTNVVLGIGSYTYQLVTRDTYGMAMKATWVRVDNEPRDIFKSPVTDTGLKKSATGRLAVTRQNGALTLIERATPEQEASSLLELVFKDGYLHRVQNLDHIRRTVIG